VSTNTSLQQDKYKDCSAYKETGEQPEFFTGVVDDLAALYNLRLILKIMLQKPCC
jgi:hypothetical protein